MSISFYDTIIYIRMLYVYTHDDVYDKYYLLTTKL